MNIGFKGASGIAIRPDETTFEFNVKERLNVGKSDDNKTQLTTGSLLTGVKPVEDGNSVFNFVSFEKIKNDFTVEKNVSTKAKVADNGNISIKNSAKLDLYKAKKTSLTLGNGSTLNVKKEGDITLHTGNRKFHITGKELSITG